MMQCPKDQLVGYGVPVSDEKCKELLTQADKQIGGYFEYALYDECWYQNDLEPPKNDHKLTMTRDNRIFFGNPAYNSNNYNKTNKVKKNSVDNFKGAQNDYLCGGPGAMFEYLNNEKVRIGLNVDPQSNFFSGDNGVGFTYNLTEKSLLPFYKHVIENTDLRVLVYNGDTDPGINAFVAQNWTRSLGIEEVEGWRPFTLDSKQYMGGYVTKYKNDFDFLTIRGSGHMVRNLYIFFFNLKSGNINILLYTKNIQVPQYKAKAALEFLTRWLNNEEFQRYVPPSSL